MTANAKRIRLAATTLLLCTVVATSVSASCLHGTSHLPRQRREAEDPRTVAVSEFGYTGAQGPLNWAALSPDNAACSLSSVQSPINIDPSGSGPGVSPATVIPLQMTIPSVETAEFLNLGTTLEVEVNGTTAVDGQSFALKQFHFHTPSEHRIGEKYFSLEMHMVHDATDGSGTIAVIAVMFDPAPDGNTTTLITDSLVPALPELVQPGAVAETGPLDFGELVNHLQTTPLFRYTGSLTTPPCAEGVTFFVTEQPLPIDVRTYLALKDVIKFNARYTQNGLGQPNLLRVAAQSSVNTTNGLECQGSPQIIKFEQPAEGVVSPVKDADAQTPPGQSVIDDGEEDYAEIKPRSDAEPAPQAQGAHVHQRHQSGRRTSRKRS